MVLWLCCRSLSRMWEKVRELDAEPVSVGMRRGLTSARQRHGSRGCAFRQILPEIVCRQLQKVPSCKSVMNVTDVTDLVWLRQAHSEGM
jgi:hypothetical protein